ncbi:MAG: ABC transporter substrate-binding protein [Burkholderiaceae bacterium]
MNYRFTLRPGLVFHDGNPVTSKDVIASLRRWGGRDTLGRKLMAAVGSLNAVDDRTFELKLEKPFGWVLYALGKPGSPVPFIMPERLARTPISEQITEVIGSGPFVFNKARWKPGSLMVFEKFKDYKPRSEPADFLAGGKVVHVDRVEWQVIPDNNTAIAALQAGELDYVQYPSFDILPVLERDPKVKVVGFTGPNMFMGNYRINQGNPPFDDPDIRRVLWNLVDQQEVLNALGVPKEFSMTCNSFWMCNSPFETEAGNEPYAKRSIAATKAALAKTKYKGEKVILLQVTELDAGRVPTEIMAQRMREAGFNVEMQSMDWNTLLSRRTLKDGWHLYGIHASGFDLMSPLTHFYVAQNCVKDVGWHCDERLTKLLDEFQAASDHDGQKRLAEEIQKVVYQISPAILYGQFAQPAAYRTDLKGVIESSIPVFWNIRK